MPHQQGSAALGTLLVTASLLAPVGPGAAAPELDAMVASIAGQLRQSWNADPGTASLPWPAIEVLPAGQMPLSACPGSGSAASEAGSVQSPALYCAAGGRVLLDRNRLAKEASRHGEWGVAYWVGIGLGTAILGQRPTARRPAAAANLQANCLAGVLIGGTSLQPRPQDPPKPDQLVAPANGAYGTAAAEQMGTRSQRSYALLTGFGMTELAGCSDGAMAQLATDQVPDPALLSALATGTDRAAFNTMAVMNRRCRRLPNSPCPRRVPPFTGQK
ncbi:hypothetical protein KBY84_04005 [Cyanobium sp. N.Huapi 1H5]|uniref:hypothetical protein n=1 Tax=Cyanobium sp. N.Huapi 1H5 TaxID=2823719 RepID=UPI0020CF3F8D|nr:hypothetical protein [Cyanobium sp. N.Huapi 1H5]MCP9836658.1 hypothetical protein [Cyanobium sp. N.Huapi 1H5]